MSDPVEVALEAPAHVEFRRQQLWAAAQEYYQLAEGETDPIERDDFLADGDMYVKWALAVAEEWLGEEWM